MSYHAVALGTDLLQHLPVPGISSGGCSIAADQYSVLTGRVEDALAERGAQVISDGIWSDRVCAAWWLVMKQPPSEQAVRALLADNFPEQCTSVAIPSCPQPDAAALKAVTVPKPGWQADIGGAGSSLNRWILGGVVALAVVIGYKTLASRKAPAGT